MSEARRRLGAAPLWGTVAEYVLGVGVIALACIVAWILPPGFVLADLVMIFLLGVVFVSTRVRLSAAIATAVLSVLVFEYLFLPPLYSFAVVDPKHLVTFTVMLFVAVVVSGLTERVRRQKEAAQLRERHTAAMYSVSRELTEGHSAAEFAAIVARRIHEVFESRVVVLMPGPDDELVNVYVGEFIFELSPAERQAARFALDHERPSGSFEAKEPLSRAVYLPLSQRGTIGVLGVLPGESGKLDDPEQQHLLGAFASLLASAIERAKLADAADRAKLEAKAEHLRSALLSSVSHDLRTPLAAITGAASTLLDDSADLAPTTRTDLVQTVYEEADRLSRWVNNLLEMTRLESGGVHLRKEWQPIEEVIGAAMSRMEAKLSGRPIETRLPSDVSMVLADDVLIQQVLVNLLENAVKYTPPGTPISVSVRREHGALEFQVDDRGPGVPEGEEERIFDKFYRAHRARGGVGLGLAICRAIVLTHGGRIWVEKFPGGGASFRFALPFEEPPAEFAKRSHSRG